MKLIFGSNASKMLFLKYAIPCGNVLVRRRSLSKARLDKLKSKLLRGEEIKDIEKIFKIAAGMCYIIAKKMKKKKIDKAVIRKYFWDEHSSAIEWRHKIYKDFDKKLCKVYPGKIIKAGKSAVVKTPIGKRKLRSDFVPGLRINDLVTVHYDYIIEKLTKGEFKRLWNKYK